MMLFNSKSQFNNQ